MNPHCKNNPLQRICIIGCCGGGKSTLSRTLASEFELPHYNLDDHFYYPNWVQPAHEDWLSEVHGLASQSKWIIDGTYSATHLDYRFERADKIIMFDLPLPICFYRILKRDFKNYTGLHVTLPKRIREAEPKPRFNLKSTLRFYRHVLRFKRNTNPIIFRTLDQTNTSHKLVLIKNHLNLQRFLNHLLPEAIKC